jgi:hypothetical protein
MGGSPRLVPSAAECVERRDWTTPAPSPPATVLIGQRGSIEVGEVEVIFNPAKNFFEQIENRDHPISRHNSTNLTNLNTLGFVSCTSP